MRTKAMLIIDMPDQCNDCILQEQGFCKGTVPYRFIHATGCKENARQDWCPLIPGNEKDKS